MEKKWVSKFERVARQAAVTKRLERRDALKKVKRQQVQTDLYKEIEFEILCLEVKDLRETIEDLKRRLPPPVEAPTETASEEIVSVTSPEWTSQPL